MEAMFYDLANRPIPWYSYLNAYNISKDRQDVRIKFIGNWKYVFGTGFGLPEETRKYLRLRYEEGLSYEEIAAKCNTEDIHVKHCVESHIETLMSPRAYGLIDRIYPLKPSQMKALYYVGFFNNYGQWNEPKFALDHEYLNIALFDMFDNPGVRNLCKKNGIHSIGSLCNWINDNAIRIQNHKAGVGKIIAGYLIKNNYVMELCKDNMEMLEKIANK